MEFRCLSGNSKYINWIDACIDEILIGEDIPELISNIILDELVKSGIVVTMLSQPAYEVMRLISLL